MPNVGHYTKESRNLEVDGAIHRHERHPLEYTFTPPVIQTIASTIVIPTAMPTIKRSSSPSVSLTPSAIHSASPSIESSAEPSTLPSSSPSSTPSLGFSSNPTSTPSRTPSVRPSVMLSAEPSISVSSTPTAILSSASPSNIRSAKPSEVPSLSPSVTTNMPTPKPSPDLSISTSSTPSMAPTLSPSNIQSAEPSSSTSSIPSAIPTNRVPSVATSNTSIGSDTTSAGSDAIIDCSSLSTDGNFGSTTGSTTTIIEYKYTITSAYSSKSGYEIGQLERAMLDAIIPPLFSLCGEERKLEESPLHRQRHLQMVGVSAAPPDDIVEPSDDIVEGSCPQQDTDGDCRYVQGRMTIYTDDASDIVLGIVQRTLCSKMDDDEFNGLYTSTTGGSETVIYTILKSKCDFNSFSYKPAGVSQLAGTVVEGLNPTNFVILGFSAVFAAFLIYAYGRWRTEKKSSRKSKFGQHLDDSDFSESSYDNDSLSSVCGPPAMDLRSVHDNRVVEDSPVRIGTIARNSHFPETIQECWAEEDDCLEDSGEISRFGLSEDSLDDMETVLM